MTSDLFGDSAEIILGVDPGISGAFAFYSTVDRSVFCYDAPVVNGKISGSILAETIANWKPNFAIVELVGSMPKQGLSSTFNFGVSYGIAQGVIAAQMIPVTFVTPGKWKRHYGLGPDKEQARGRALQLWPARGDMFGRKKDHGRAEAALLARYYVETRARK